MIISRTPLRIPLGGGGTDLTSYSSLYEGFVLSVAINRYVFITLNPRKLDNLYRISYSKTEIVSDILQIQNPIVRTALSLNQISHGVEITSIGDVPGGSGLGSSGAFTVGLLNAIHTYKREHRSATELAEEACTIEISKLKEPIGKHDQYITACGGLTCLEIKKDGKVLVNQLRLDEEVLDELEQNIILFYTGKLRNASDVLNEQFEKVKRRKIDTIESLHRIKEIGYAIKECLVKGDLKKFGELLHEHWEEKKSLSNKITDDQIDTWYRLGIQNGALGGKIIGAGGGGFLLFYCESLKKNLREILTKQGLVEMKFRFDFEGTKIIANF